MSEDLDNQITSAGLLSTFQTRMLKTAKEKRTVGWLKTNFETLESLWKEFHARHLVIARDSELKGDAYFTEDCYGSAQANYVEVKTAILNALNPGRAQSSVEADEDFETVVFETRQRTKLPTIDLPKFSGNQVEWESFKEMFLAVVHEVPSIPPVMKLQYLLASLSGEAARRLSNTKIKAANYQGAWETLTKKYDNDRVNISAHMQSIISCPPASRKSEGEISRVLSVILEAKRGLENLKCPVQHWDAWLIFHTLQKLDGTTREEWEMNLGDQSTMPTFAQLVTFLDTYMRALETAHATDGTVRQQSTTQATKPKAKVAHTHMAATDASDKTKRSKARACPCCKEQHNLSNCERYRALPVSQRRTLISAQNMCENCLKPKHSVSECRAPGRCYLCGQKHHTSLHAEVQQSNQADGTGQREGRPRDSTAANNAPTQAAALNMHCAPSMHMLSSSHQVLLATAIVRLQNSAGESIMARALLDQGSEFSFITVEAAQSLSLKGTEVNVSISGIGSASPGSARALVTARLKSQYRPDLDLRFEALVLGKLTDQIPPERVDRKHWPHLHGLQLADPSFGSPGKIDCIIGAELYGQLLTGKICRGAVGEPIAQETALGWVLSGPTHAASLSHLRESAVRTFHVSTHMELHDAIMAFWKVEELPSRSPQSPDDEYCEQHFASTVQRDDSGRFIVSLPRRKPILQLGDSRSVAVACWLRTERKLARYPLQAKMYHDFLREYLTLGHMKEASEDELQAFETYYMPHHAVFKRIPGSAELKIRVVFNASQASTNGNSLNDALYPGPNIPEELWIVLTRWRFLRLVFTADSVKNFRQTRVTKRDSFLQLIVWREDPKDELKTYRLLTVTYGTAPAPYLSKRVLLELAKRRERRYPLAARIIRRHKYVDDFLAGGDSEEEVEEAITQLVALLEEAGFPLGKWSSNDPSLLKGVFEKAEDSEKQLGIENCVSVLGTAWIPCQDHFIIKVGAIKNVTTWTKRAVLSEVAKLFDPLGWLGPVVIRAKALLQDLWLSGADWDEQLPTNLLSRWEKFVKELPELTTIQIPRWFGSTASSTLQLHAFSDASERAYAACVYLVAINGNTRTSSLVLAKTKVAPIKTLSIPRLELCGAHLAARMAHELHLELECGQIETFCWTDSKVVLCWLTNHASKWNTFVATRVGDILTLLPTTKWQHVASKENPADLASRGASPSELRDAKLWWSGPSWLVDNNPPATSVGEQLSVQDAPEARKPNKTILVSQVDDEGFLLRFSSYTRLVRVTAYCLRFITTLRDLRAKKERVQKHPYLSSTELLQARNALLRKIQLIHFADELRALKNGSPISSKSPLLPFRPYLDDSGLLRVGGRLVHSVLPYSEKYPILLPKQAYLTRLLISYAHSQTMHGGTQLTHSFLSRCFWIIHAKIVIPSILKECVKCARFDSKPRPQLMGDLPPHRVQEARPFLRSGVDYAGPLKIRTSKGRGQRSYKGYICIFVCMAVKAVHLEIASDLSTAAFLAAYKRFVARRGRCAELYSDNATNFHGADAELHRLFRESSTLEGVGPLLENDGTKWNFIPPGAPHFGGLWEAAVKATKRHLRRVVGETALTYEELATLTAQVEACLNSRPLFVLSSDARDLPAITPAHYLIGSSLVAPPEPYDSKLSESNPVSRWVLITRMRNQFWHSWRRDYLHTLQQRTKWRQPTKNPAIGEVVLIMNENLPPTKWSLGKITRVFPDKKGWVRVVEVKTSTSTFERPTTKICRLPVFNVESQTEELEDLE